MKVHILYMHKMIIEFHRESAESSHNLHLFPSVKPDILKLDYYCIS